MFRRHEDQVVVAPHLLQDGGQSVEVSVGEVLSFPQVKDNPCGAGPGRKVVQVPGEGHTHTDTQSTRGRNVQSIVRLYLFIDIVCEREIGRAHV